MRCCRLVAGLFVLIAAATDDALACDCGISGPPCQATWSADAVFAGAVRSIQQIDHDQLGAPYMSLLVKFDVERAFVNAVPGPVEVVTGTGSGDCGYPFRTGGRYLVYAWKTPSTRLGATRCSRTRPLDEAEEDLRYLTTMPAAGVGARIYGRITRWHRDPFEDNAVDYGPVEGLLVNVRGAAFSRDAVTDTNGRYELSGIPVGTVILTVMLPPEFDQPYLEREFELKDPRACGEYDFQVSYIARVSGTVVDATGRPLAGLSIDAVAAELAGHQPPAYQRPVKTDQRGWFVFEDLPPGSYVFGVNLTKDPGQQASGVATFFPGSSIVADAAVIELKPGERKDLGVLRLPDGR